MADDDKDSKTELPSEKRVQEAFERGQFAKSTELQVVAMLAGAMAIIGFVLPSAVRDLGGFATSVWRDLARAKLRFDEVPIPLQEGALVLAKILVPVVGTLAVAALLIGGFQTGFRFTPNVLGFKLERLDPSSGFGRVFSHKSLVNGGIDMLKLTGVGIVLWMAVRKVAVDPIFYSPVEASYLGDFLKRATLELLSKLIIALGIVAAVSYSYEKYRTSKDLMMSRQEIKDEHKQSEGDGQTKAAMRRMARRLLQKQMLAAIPMADVVVTNPTHYAVALKYERGRDQAPMVLAKGENQFARRLKALAAEHGVPMVENKPVARMLYTVGKVGETIPSELYQAVAGILAFVYRTHRLYFHELKMRRTMADAIARRSA